MNRIYSMVVVSAGVALQNLFSQLSVAGMAVDDPMRPVAMEGNDTKLEVSLRTKLMIAETGWSSSYSVNNQHWFVLELICPSFFVTRPKTLKQLTLLQIRMNY